MKRAEGTDVQTVAISCIRDEGDIVEPFVRHTLAHVDRLVVLDNGSTDGTRHLLQQLVAEGQRHVFHQMSILR